MVRQGVAQKLLTGTPLPMPLFLIKGGKNYKKKY
jgi:hypothetical protein